RLQCSQQLSELSACARELLGGLLGLLPETTPLVEQELLLLRFEPIFLLERGELVASMRECFLAELRNEPVVRNRSECRAHDRAQLLELLACLVHIGPAVDRAGGILDLLVELGNALLELVETLGELFDRRDAVRLSAALGKCWTRRRDQKQH